MIAATPTTALAVPYRSQHDSDALGYRRDCGTASVAMLIEFWTGARVGIDALSRETRLAGGATLLDWPDLTALLEAHGVDAETAYLRDTNAIRGVLDAGRPVIATVRYDLIPDRQDTGYTGGHFFVIVGHDALADAFIVNDPDWWGARRDQGAGFRVRTTDLLKAMAAYSYGCVVGVGVKPPPQATQYMKVTARPYLNARFAPGLKSAVMAHLPTGTIVTLSSTTIVTLDGHNWVKLESPGAWWVALEHLEATDAPPLPPLEQHVWITATPHLNVRAKPSTSATVVGRLPFGTDTYVTERVQAEDRYWRKVSGREHNGGWIAESYLTTTPPEPPPTQTLRGVNIDPLNTAGHGNPGPEDLKGASYARFVANNYFGGKVQPVEALISFYAPLARGLLAQGVTPVIIVNWQTYGQGDVPNYDDISAYAPQLAAHVQTFVGGMPDGCVYQVWNEGDGTDKTVPVAPDEYARILMHVVPAIRGAKPNTRIWSQGHVTNNPAYWSKVRAAAPTIADSLEAVCVHVYGHGEGEYAPNGPLAPLGTKWRAVLAAGQRLVATEASVLDRPDAPEAKVAAYARGLLRQAEGVQFAALFWFAFGNQDNGYPMWNKPELQKVFGITPANPNPAPVPATRFGIGANAVGFAGAKVYKLTQAFDAAATKLGPLRFTNDKQGFLFYPASTKVLRFQDVPGDYDPLAEGASPEGWIGRFADNVIVEGMDYRNGEYAQFHNERVSRKHPRHIDGPKQGQIDEAWRERLKWWVQFELRMMQLIEAYGSRTVRLVIFGFPVAMGGDPVEEWEIEEMRPALVWARDHGHILGGNVYYPTYVSDEEARATMRYLRTIAEAVPGLKYLVCEHGVIDATWSADWQNETIFERGLLAAIEVYGDDPDCLGLCEWCLNGFGGGWDKSDIPESAYPMLARHGVKK